jgi:hypothetical protein
MYGRALLVRDGDDPSPEARDALQQAAELAPATGEAVVAYALIGEVGDPTRLEHI